jgi:hypothetical protein
VEPILVSALLLRRKSFGGGGGKARRSFFPVSIDVSKGQGVWGDAPILVGKV